MKLEDIDKKDPFKAPDGYFEDFSAKLQARVRQQEAQAKVVKWQPALKWSGYAAAAVALLLTVGLLLNRSAGEQQKGENLALEQISKEEIYHYLLKEEEITYQEITEIAGNDLKLGLSEDEIRLTPELMEEFVELEDIEDYL